MFQLLYSVYSDNAQTTYLDLQKPFIGSWIIEYELYLTRRISSGVGGQLGLDNEKDNII